MLDFTVYPLVLVVAITLLMTPIFLNLASKQDKKTKENLKWVWVIFLITQFLMGALNWENFSENGRSGLQFALLYPNSLLGLFFIITLLQIILLAVSQSFNKAIMVLNFINSILIFVGMVRLSSILSFQPVSMASVGAVFLVLSGNVIGLVYLNKDKGILKKYFQS